MSSKQTNPWIKEVLFAAVLILLSIITSLVLNNWSISIILWTFVYIIWKWIELYHFYRWYIQGSYSKYPPLTTGVFEILSNHVIKNNKYN